MHLLLTNSHIISRSQSTQFIDIKKYKNGVLKSDTIGLQNEYKNATILGNVDEIKVLLRSSCRRRYRQPSRHRLRRYL